MNIFLVLHPSGNLSVPGSLTWYKNLYEPLIDLGHKVYFYRLDEKEKKWGLKLRTQKFKQRLSEDLLKTVNIEHSKNNFDLFFSYLNDLDIETGVIDEIKKIGILTLNFSCNNTHQFHLIKNISPHFDYNLHSEKSAGTKFENIGANHIWFQMAANPKYYYPIDLQRDKDVSFVGMNYAKRALYIEHLLKNEVDLECYGPGWLPPPFPRVIEKELKKVLFNLKLLFRQGEKEKLSAFINDYKYKKRFSKKKHSL